MRDRRRCRRRLDGSHTAEPMRSMPAPVSHATDPSPQTHGARASQPAASSFATCRRTTRSSRSSPISTAGNDTTPSLPMNRPTRTVPGPGTTVLLTQNTPPEVAADSPPSAPPARTSHPRSRLAADYPNPTHLFYTWGAGSQLPRRAPGARLIPVLAGRTAVTSGPQLCPRWSTNCGQCPGPALARVRHLIAVGDQARTRRRVRYQLGHALLRRRAGLASASSASAISCITTATSA